MDKFGVTGLEDVHIVGIGRVFDLCQQVWDTTENSKKDIDFADMLWIPVRDKLITPRDRYDWLLVDEVQDLNPLQQEFAIRMGRRIVAVGDSKQAIYGFAGADTAGMSNFKQRLDGLGGCTELPLSICYRCPASVVRKAQDIVPYIESREDAPEGEVAMDAVFDPKVGHLVLCRCTAPLVEAAIGLLRNGTAVGILGRDFATTLTDIVDQWEGKFLTQDLLDWNEKEVKRLEKRSKAAKERQQELYECLTILVGKAGIFDKTALSSLIKSMFSDAPKDSTVNLMTIHRSKGLEAEHVWIIRPDLMPHPNVESDWELEQEMNLKYVAITRAQKSLHFCPQNKDVDEPEEE